MSKSDRRPEHVEQRLARREAELAHFGTLAYAVRVVLMRDWDPCGIDDVPECADEYDSYIPTVCRLLLDGCSVVDVANYLFWVESERIGLRSWVFDNCLKVATTLRGLLPAIGERYRRMHSGASIEVEVICGGLGDLALMSTANGVDIVLTDAPAAIGEFLKRNAYEKVST